MAVTTTLVAVAGVAMSAYGTIQQGQTASKAAAYNAQVAKNNADREKQKAQFEATRQSRLQAQLMGRQRAAGGAAGITSESLLDVISDSAKQSELDKLLILNEGQAKGAGYEGEALMSSFQGKQAKQASYISAASTLVSGASSAYSSGKFG